MEITTSKMCYDDIHNHLITQSSDFPYPEEFAEQYAYKLSKNAEFLTAYDTNKSLCGLIAYYANRVPDAYISHLWVDQSNRRNGICSSMLRVLHSLLSSQGFKTIRLEVRKDNEPAIGAYSKMGYSINSASDKCYLMELRL